MFQVHLQECFCEGNWGANARGLVEIYYSGSRGCDFIAECSFQANDPSLEGWDQAEISEALIAPLFPDCVRSIQTYWAVAGGSVHVGDDVVRDHFNGSIQNALNERKK